MSDLIVFDQDKFNHAMKVAGTLAKSSIVPACFRGKPEDIFATLILGNELGMSPMNALNAIVMIQGQCTLKASTQMALVRSKVPNAVIKIELDEVELIAKCTCARSKDDLDNAYTATWSMDKAAAFGLSNKDNYKKQPMNMLKWRAVTEALRVVFPDLLLGLMSTEEMVDQDEIKKEVESVMITQSDIDKDFPIPENEKVIGHEYRIQNAKYRGKQLKDIGIDELEEYRETLRERVKKGAKSWEADLFAVINTYLMDFVYADENNDAI
jgi:hypothetical protein